MSMKSNYLRIAELLDQGRSLVWARIVDRVGSAPRAVGSDCLVLDDGTLVGTIGGGTLEHVVVGKAQKMMHCHSAELLRFRMQGEDVDQSEMLCGGIVDVLLNPLNPSDGEAVSIFSVAKTLIEAGHPATFVSRVPSLGDREGRANRWMVVTADRVVEGRISAFPFSLSKLSRLSSPTLLRCPDSGAVFFVEPLECTPVIVIFGAGHISTCIAPIAKMVGFRVAVIDDRPEYANRERFPTADDLYVMPFEQALKELPIGPHTYIVIVTRGHKYDKVVLESMLDKPHAYVGMIGSRHKRDTIYQAFISAGVSSEILTRVYAPIGLDIGAETPEEIAVSIVAELIDVRAAKRVAAALPKPPFVSPRENGG